MRILLVSHAAGPYGAERVLLALARGLSGRGHDVVIEFPQPGPALDAARGEPGLQSRLVERHRLPRNVREGMGYLAAAGSAIRSARRTIREVAPDLIWINSLYNPWAALAASASGVPVVWHLHELRPREPLGVAMAALIGLSATRVAVVSQYAADGWSRYPWLRSRISVLPNPLLGDVAATGEPSGPFTVGYVGQLEPLKRVLDLVRAVARLPAVRAVIVGDGKARSAVESLIREIGVEDRLEMTGFQDDVGAQLARFHVLAIPSLREAFGLVALEAMAAGVPVVAARSGALPEVLDSAALFHAPGDPASLAEQVLALETDPGLRRDLAARGRRRLAAFSEDAWLDGAESLAASVSTKAAGSVER